MPKKSDFQWKAVDKQASKSDDFHYGKSGSHKTDKSCESVGTEIKEISIVTIAWNKRGFYANRAG